MLPIPASKRRRLTISERALVMARYERLQRESPLSNGTRALRYAGLVSSLLRGSWGNSAVGWRLHGARGGMAHSVHPIQGPLLRMRAPIILAKGRLQRAMNLKAAGRPYQKLLASVDRKPGRPVDRAAPSSSNVRHPRKAKSSDDVQF